MGKKRGKEKRFFWLKLKEDWFNCICQVKNGPFYN